MSPTERIRQLLADTPGLKAREIALSLGLDRSQVVNTLHSLLGDSVIQDNHYRWWPATRSPSPISDAPAPRGFLANLCRYYLECLSHESGAGISIPLTSTADYVALDQLPFPQNALPLHDRSVKRLLQKVRREPSQLTLYLGYALRLRSVQTRQHDELRLEPVLLYPIEDQPGQPLDSLRPSTGVPLFNLEVLKSMLAADSGNLMDEAIHLLEELGLANPEDDLPPWDEIILRLPRSRPEWRWREPLDPYLLPKDPPLTSLTAPGIYNRAILFAGTRSPFTYGLEIELRKLSLLADDAVRDTALGLWLGGENIEAPPAQDRPILEVLPLNTEQRQAVVQGLAAPLTVVTGPPGTGKSQVVTSLLANLAWQGASVLFSSKNNHAVDVVEARVNDLGPYPLLLRLGREEHHTRIAQHLTAELAESANSEDDVRYTWLANAHEQDRQQFHSVQRAMAEVVALRNHVDELERAAEPARAIFGGRLPDLRPLDLPTLRLRAQSLADALEAALGGGQPAIVRLLGDPWKGRRFERIADAAASVRDHAARLSLPLPAAPPSHQTLPEWQRFSTALSTRIHWAAAVDSYLEALDRLRHAPAIELLATQLTRIAEESAHTSRDLWQTWLRLRPARWNPDQRKMLSEYLALLQMIASGDHHDESGGRRIFRRYYSLFPKVTKVLPCWAVTSLSARGRLPFEPACFDVVIIDEASQCDIASALPLLFRARRAVIIGDPLQLKHVSTVAPQQDRLLLPAHGLAEGSAAWAYSVNSLFDLARSLCRREDIVNLRDHHRSHRDIISFSNRHFYRGGLRIATDHEALNRPQPEGAAVRWVHLKGKVARPAGGGALNTVEAQAVVKEVRKLVLEQHYSGAIGVVSPFRAQANRIRTLVHQDRELTQSLASLHFIVDTVHGFQGDERDVIVFSPVISAGVSEGTLRFLKNNANLFNVAVTRARSELIVVGDRQAALDSGVPYLARFAEYARDLEAHETHAPSATPGPDYPPVAHPEHVSEWERIFYRALFAAGVRPVPQYEDAPHTLDFALFEGERKLDIEVDGENYHRNWDGELCRRDQIRSRRLSDLGWEIMRFWVYEIRDHLDESVARVQSWLREPVP